MQRGQQNYFQTNFTTTFAETNVVGNIYFANYVLWQGKCRELFLAEFCPDVLQEIQSGLALVTLDLSCTYLEQLHALEPVVMHMHLEAMTESRALMAFEYFRREPGRLHLVCRSHQSVASMRAVDGVLQPVPFPPSIIESIQQYQLIAPGRSSP